MSRRHSHFSIDDIAVVLMKADEDLRKLGLRKIASSSAGPGRRQGLCPCRGAINGNLAGSPASV